MAVKDDINPEVKEDSIEESSASNTLKAGASKSEMLSQMIKYVAGMKKEDLSVFLTKTLAQVGKEDETVPDYSGKNAASISMHSTSTPAPTTFKEDIDDLFESDDLSEEFKGKASTLFEAAVANRINVEIARLEEEFEEKLESSIEESVKDLDEKVSSYLDYVAEEWMKKNELEITKSIRVENTEKFIEGLKNLFKESYIEVPEDKVDLIGELEEKVNSLEEKLNNEINEKVEMQKELLSSKIENVFNSVTEDLADTQIEKLRVMSESISFETIEEYKEKIQTIREEYFKEASTKKTGLINEEGIGMNEVDESEEVIVPEEMRNYVSAISKTIKK